ncbi:MAG TPA: CCA tRNA nucleotidyltransferase [Spirochaetia bacterium]|nr:MAG: hypothetical protein A2Y41_14130 [Spirochaetes bacterium GWB1_36_13]HCL57360.1 CCA tRNA nucleotidyltransferase [Spirochaetia bacterium]
MISFLKKTEKYPKALQIANRLKEKGHQVVFAGGCVRDAFLKREIKDIDIATSAEPQEIVQIFKKTVSIGAQFGVIMVIQEGEAFEVATFRKDGQYQDGRRPESVSFTEMKEDAARRDFTINGLFFDPFSEKIIDYTNGIHDIRKKVIRCIGNPFERFEEDKLRILRAVRFSAKLKFKIEKKTLEAMKFMAPKIVSVSRERIREEIFKLFESSKIKKYLKLIYQSGLWDIVFPFSYQKKNIRFADKISNTILPEIRFTALFWQESPEKIKEICLSFKFSNKQSEIIFRLKTLLDHYKHLSSMRLSELKRIFMTENFDQFLDFLKQFQKSFYPGRKNILKKLKKIYEKEKNTLNLEKLINGEDLIELGLSPSPVFKKLLYEIENLQLEHELNNREDALRWLKKELLKYEIN